MQLQSGTEHGITLGTPIGLLVRNEDQRPKDYSETDLYPRPSHADWTYLESAISVSVGGALVVLALYVPKTMGTSEKWYARRYGREEMSGNIAGSISDNG